MERKNFSNRGPIENLANIRVVISQTIDLGWARIKFVPVYGERALWIFENIWKIKFSIHLHSASNDESEVSN